MKPREAFFLVGPTAVGKTAAAQSIAEDEGWEVLSADSMLIYRGMDIGTAKPTPAERARVRYHGIDLVEANRSFSAWDYRRYAVEALDDAARRGVGVIVVGGTGLYIRALLEGLENRPPANAALRTHWQAVLDREGITPLQEALRSEAPAAYAALADPENPRRLLRALESVRAGWAPSPGPDPVAAVPLAGLTADRAWLGECIGQRIDAMYANGLVEEARALRARYGDLSETARHAIGYAEAFALLDGDLSEAQARDRTATRTRQLAKRQETWFRHQASVAWFRAGDDTPMAGLVDNLKDYWRQHGPLRIPD